MKDENIKEGFFSKLKTEGRIGKVIISDSILCSLDKDELNLIFRELIIVRAEHLLHIPAMEYIAFSEFFDRTIQGHEMPYYEAKIWLNANSKHKTIKWEAKYEH